MGEGVQVVGGASSARSVAVLLRLLYLICMLADFSAFVVIFTASRSLAESGAESWYLGVVGAGLSFCSGVGSILGGWLSHRFDGRVIFVSGAVLVVASTASCGLIDPRALRYLPGYWLLGIGLGFLYPPLMGWLNRGEDAHANRRGVSRRLILFCVSWNLGMMCGQLTAGWLFEWGPSGAYGAALAVALVAVFFAIVAARRVAPVAALPIDATPADQENREVASAFKRLSWLANLGGMFGGSMVVHLLPDLAVSIGVDPSHHGNLLACWRVAIIATYLLMHFADFWHYRLDVALASQLLGACGLVVIGAATSWQPLLVGLALLGQLVGYNYFSGLFYSTAGSSTERRALAAGIHEATLALGMAVGTIVGGVLGTLAGPRAPYILAAAVLVLVTGAQVAAWRRWARPLRRKAQAAAAAAS